MRALALLPVALAAVSPSPARAWDSFEVQVYDPEINTPGQFGLELHENYTPSGLHTSELPELPTDQVLHQTLEASLGLGERLELGAYLQVAVRGHDSRVDFAGAKVRLKWRAPIDEHFPIQAGANLELSAIPDSYEAAVGGVEVRPIVQWREGDFRLDFNPIVSVPLSGPYAGIAEIDPALAVRYRFFATVEVSLEYYGTSGPLTHVPHLVHQLHYLFETIDIVKWPEWELRFGIGEGLTPGSDSVLLTMVLGHTF